MANKNFTLEQLQDLNILSTEFPDETMEALADQFQTESDPAVKQALNAAFISGAVLLNSQYGLEAFTTTGIKEAPMDLDLDVLDLTVPSTDALAPGGAVANSTKNAEQLKAEKDEDIRVAYEALTNMTVGSKEEIEALEAKYKETKLPLKEQKETIKARIKTAKEGLKSIESKKMLEVIKKMPLTTREEITAAKEAAKVAKLEKSEKDAFAQLVKDALAPIEAAETAAKNAANTGTEGGEGAEKNKKRGSKARIDEAVMVMMAKMINRGDKNRDIAEFFGFDAANVSDLKSGYGRYAEHSPKLIKAKNAEAPVAAPDEFKTGDFIKEGKFDWDAYFAHKAATAPSKEPHNVPDTGDTQNAAAKVLAEEKSIAEQAAEADAAKGGDIPPGAIATVA